MAKVRGRGSWQAIALEQHVAQRVAWRHPFFCMSGRSSHMAAFLFQRFARLYGMSRVNNHSCERHQARGVALNEAPV